ncbi:MAG: copper resistance protein CopC, partial [Ensifer alkalisoli]|nr:copper resistance protein CopC [Sinorhizobium alkalisoli]
MGAPTGLGRGTHVLSWRVISADGHPVGGSVVFSISEADAAPPPIVDEIDRTVRAGVLGSKVALYIGLFIGVGGVFASVWLLGDSRPGRNVAGGALGIGNLGALASRRFPRARCAGGTRGAHRRTHCLVHGHGDKLRPYGRRRRPRLHHRRGG